MDPLTQMNCPACGGPALVQESVTTLRCENCNSIVQRSSSTSFLEILGIGCYSCGAVNDKGIKYCTNYGTELIVECLDCGNSIVLGQKKCGQCGVDILEVYTTKVSDLEQSIEEKNEQVHHYEKRIEESQSSKEQISKRRTKLIILGFFISVFGSIIIAILIGLADKSEFLSAFTISLCLFGPIIGGLIFIVFFVFIIYFSNSAQFKIDNKIKYANIYKQQAIEENILIKNDLSEYLKFMSAYNNGNP